MVGLSVKPAENLDRFLQRARAPAPAIIAGLIIRHIAGVGFDIGIPEIVLHPNKAFFKTPAPFPGLVQ